MDWSSIPGTKNVPTTANKTMHKRKSSHTSQEPTKYMKFSDHTSLNESSHNLINELIQFLYLMRRSSASRHLLNIFIDKVDRYVRNYGANLREYD